MRLSVLEQCSTSHTRQTRVRSAHAKKEGKHRIKYDCEVILDAGDGGLRYAVWACAQPGTNQNKHIFIDPGRGKHTINVGEQVRYESKKSSPKVERKTKQKNKTK